MTDRYARQNMLPEFEGRVDDLKRMKIGVIGAGGLGGLFSLLVALAGVGTVRIADRDGVELHNLHRQLLFTEGDVGGSKVRCAAAAIRARQSECDVEEFERYVDEDSFENFASGLDLIADLSDSSESRLAISRLCMRRGTDLLSGAVSGLSAQAAVFAFSRPEIIRDTGCYRCLTQGARINTRVGITGPAAACAASLCAQMCLEHLLSLREPTHLVRLDLKSMSMRSLRLHADAACPDCAKRVV